MWFGEDGAKQEFMDILPCFEESNEYQVELVTYMCVLLNVWQDDMQGTEFESFFFTLKNIDKDITLLYGHRTFFLQMHLSGLCF